MSVNVVVVSPVLMPAGSVVNGATLTDPVWLRVGEQHEIDGSLAEGFSRNGYVEIVDRINPPCCAGH